MAEEKPHIIIVGAGIAGLASALRLSQAGARVTVLEAHAAPGGKMRTVPSDAGPVDAGPTVLTMRPVFEALFADVGLRLADHVALTKLDTLARHYWDDGTCLDLMADAEASLVNVRDVFGTKTAQDFEVFCARAKRLFEAFDAPMMQTAAPNSIGLAARVAREPSLIPAMAPHRTLAGLLETSFREPKLRQLFGRYATYVGGSPLASPAILSLIWHAEALGVWTVGGGMNALARAIEGCAKAFGATFDYGRPVRRIVQQNGRVAGVETDTGVVSADAVLFNGDPRALAEGLLGPAPRNAVARMATEPRSLSAYVGAFAAKPEGVNLAHHTVFFGSVPNAEFPPLEKGGMPQDATLYLCAQDHGSVAPEALQRFEVIMNAPPLPGDETKEKAQCQTLIFDRFRDFGLRFSPEPRAEDMTTPAGFETLFPASQGSLYGRSPHGMMAAFKRPTARTSLKGLYLCGGGAHPGAGVPMATLSARHAAEAILSDQTSISTSPKTATRGGTSMASRTVAPKQSLSSGS